MRNNRALRKTPNRPVSRLQGGNHTKLKWIPIWVYPAVFIFAVVTVWLRLAVIRSGYDINQTEKMIRNLHQEQEQVELKVAGLKSPRRLEQIAKTKLGLFQPKAEQVVHVR